MTDQSNYAPSTRPEKEEFFNLQAKPSFTGLNFYKLGNATKILASSFNSYESQNFRNQNRYPSFSHYNFTCFSRAAHSNVILQNSRREKYLQHRRFVRRSWRFHG